MTTVLGITTTRPIPAVLSAMQDLPLRNIQESKTNPSSQFEETKLADNIRLRGVLGLSRAASRMRRSPENDVRNYCATREARKVRELGKSFSAELDATVIRPELWERLNVPGHWVGRADTIGLFD